MTVWIYIDTSKQVGRRRFCMRCSFPVGGRRERNQAFSSPIAANRSARRCAHYGPVRREAFISIRCRNFPENGVDNYERRRQREPADLGTERRQARSCLAPVSFPAWRAWNGGPSVLPETGAVRFSGTGDYLSTKSPAATGRARSK